MSLEKEINILFRMALDLEARQKKGEHVTEKEVEKELENAFYGVFYR